MLNFFITEFGKAGEGWMAGKTGSAAECTEHGKFLARAYAGTGIKIRTRRMTLEECWLYFPISTEMALGPRIAPASEEYLDCLAEADV